MILVFLIFQRLNDFRTGFNDSANQLVYDYDTFFFNARRTSVRMAVGGSDF